MSRGARIAMAACALVATRVHAEEPKPEGLAAVVQEAIADLGLEHAGDFHVDDDVALAARAKDPETARALIGLAAAELAKEHVARVRELELEPGKRGAAEEFGELDRRAREGGAEWLLVLSLGRGAEAELRAELRAVDRGLWEAVPQPTPIVAYAARALRPERPETERLGLGRAWFSLPLTEPLLALAACDLDGDGRAELLALGARELIVLAGAGDTFEPVLRQPVEGPRAETPVRDRIGGVVCAELDDGPAIAFGTSDLARGRVVRIERIVGVPPYRAVAAGDLPGIPLGIVDRKLILAHPDRGTNRWARSVRLAAIGQPGAEVELPAAFYALAAPREARPLLVGLDYGLQLLGPDLRDPSPAGSSGIGAALAGDWIVATSTVPRAADALVLRPARPAARPVARLPLPGAVSATALGSLRASGSFDLAVALSAPPTLSFVPLDPPR